MDRREFCASVGFAALALPSVGVLSAPPVTGTAPVPTAAPAGRRTLRKAVMLGMVNDASAKTVVERFSLLRDCGFEGVEIDWPVATPIEEFAAAQEKTGLRIHGVVNSQHWKSTLNHGSPNVRKKGLDALTDCLRAAQTLGASSVLLVPGVVNADNAYDDCWNLSREQINLALPVAKETDVTIAVENVWNGFLLSPLEAAAYVDSFNSPALKFHFDIGNIVNAGWPHHWVRILAQRICKLHIKDFSRKKRDDQGLWKGFDVELGAGDAGWTAVMNALDATGYSTAVGGNWATAEVRGGDRKRLEQVSAQMSDLFTR